MITNNFGDSIYTRNSQHLIKLGWTSHFQTQVMAHCNEEVAPARVVGVRKNSFCISDGSREWLATAAGRLKHGTDCPFPVTGDWVLVMDSVITTVLIRKNSLSRGAAGTRCKQNGAPQREQVIAANLDTVFIVCGLDRDFNLRRIERYLTLVYNCGLTPVIILTKADQHQHPEHFLTQVEAVAFGVPTHLVSAHDGTGLDMLKKYLSPGQTTVMVGSSGAGKSTLVNRLYGKPIQATGPISISVGKGTHTTTTRDLIMMPQGGMVIDNPGIREIVFWNDEDGLGAAFPEIERLAGQCRFSDCSHRHEPGCRVRQAVDDGDLLQNRLDSFHKMKRELAYLSDRQNKSADRLEKERWKDVALKVKAMKKRKGKYEKH